jgi:hypothetical protein
MWTSGKTALIVCGLVIALGVPAAAAALDLGPREPALRVGVSFQPDQFHAGFQVAIGPDRRVRFRPSLDVGVGNSVRLGSLNGDVVVRLARTNASFRPYLGGGPGLNLIDVTSGVGEARGVEAKLVGHAVAGVAWARPALIAERLFLEVRGGFGDTADVKITVGVWF